LVYPAVPPHQTEFSKIFRDYRNQRETPLDAPENALLENRKCDRWVNKEAALLRIIASLTRYNGKSPNESDFYNAAEVTIGGTPLHCHAGGPPEAFPYLILILIVQ
jgi:hypothetical protein